MNRFGWLKLRDPASFFRLTGVLFLVYMGTGLWSPQLAAYAERTLGATTFQIGLVIATFQITSLASQYWWGQRTDRLGQRKPLLLLGTAGLALAYVGVASAPTWGWLIVARLLEGVALAAYSTGSLALVGDLLENQANRGRLMGLYRMFGSLAFSIAALSGGLLADNVSARAPFAVAAGCYLLALLLSSQIREQRVARLEPEPAAQPAPAEEPRLDPRQRRVLGPFLSLAFMWMFGMGAVVSLWPVYMGHLGYSKTDVGALWALAALGEVPCLMLAGYLSDIWGRKRVLLLGLSSMACVFAAYTVSSAGAWMVGVQMFRSFAYSCFEAPALLYATELGLRQQRGRLAGLYYSANGVGGIAGATLGGAAAQYVGLPTMYRAVVVVMLLTALVVARIMPRLRTQEEINRRGAETQSTVA
jgi:PPP family 3-phenylpropionic acid transporter